MTIRSNLVSATSFLLLSALDAALAQRCPESLGMTGCCRRPSLGNGYGPHSIIASGSSISFLNAAMYSAPTAPSTTRWSTESVQLMTVAMASAPSLTTGRGSPAPTASMQPWGGLMIAANSLVPYMRSEEHTSELQSLMRISYAVFCLKKQTYQKIIRITVN